MIYAVIDTNVIVSALLSNTPTSPTVKILDAIIDRYICPLYSSEIIDEYIDVLKRPKFKLPIEKVSAIVNLVKVIGLESERINSSEDFIDLDDAVFYEVALSKEDAFLVTGNLKHFPRRSIVVTPSEMIQILEQMGYIL